MRKAWMAMLAVLISALAHAQPAEALFSPEGYRISHYRGPVHEAPQGVRRIDAATLARFGGKALLLDVMPAEGGYRDDKGHWHLAVARQTIPGAHWFPEAGRGVLAPGIDSWFTQGVKRLTGGHRHRMIVTFCLADCWMSWNAARRLRAMGYTNVWWLAEGTDGWRESGQPLVTAVPEGN